MYEPVFIQRFTAKDLKKPEVQKEIMNGVSNDLTYFNVNFGLDMKDPVGSFLRQAEAHDKLDELIVCQMKIKPSNNDIESVKDHSIFYENMPMMATLGGYLVGSEYPIACSVHHSEEGGIYYTFSNINRVSGEVGEDLCEQLYYTEDKKDNVKGESVNETEEA